MLFQKKNWFSMLRVEGFWLCAHALFCCGWYNKIRAKQYIIIFIKNKNIYQKIFENKNGIQQSAIYNYWVWNIFGKKPSPPSARVAARSDMRHETSLKHIEPFLDTSLKPLWKILGTTLRLPRNTLKTSLTLSWNLLKIA